ncbi:MAG: hypothetical protein DRO99_00570 [Candidatus Aenigmatarchaeota archaeon]|nr:MAG: hypothetical protein DRO99_00570 [Candidatus Aenigmarchaeota archaeon]
MKTKSIILIIATLVVSASIGVIGSIMIWDYNITAVVEIPMSFSVENIGAFNTDTDAIHFGSVPKGSLSKRKIKVEAEANSMVTAFAVGNISSVVTISENNFFVSPDEPKHIELVAYAPTDVEYITRYTGMLRLIFRRA